MQSKYGKDGLVAVSVNVAEDPVEVTAERVTKFLEKNKAAGVMNVKLEEKLEFWKEKFHNEGILPSVFVFNRQGKYVRFPTAENELLDYKDVEKLAVQFLQEKP